MLYYKMSRLFYYKMQRKFIRKCVRFFITNCDSYYKLRRFYYKMRRLLQIATVQIFISTTIEILDMQTREKFKKHSYLQKKIFCSNFTLISNIIFQGTKFALILQILIATVIDLKLRLSVSKWAFTPPPSLLLQALACHRQHVFFFLLLNSFLKCKPENSTFAQPAVHSSG